MKNILIVIYDMKIGGAQKSLMNFLRCWDASEMKKGYGIDLMILKPGGEFFKMIPESVHIVEPPRELRWMGSNFNAELCLKYFSLRGLWGELLWLLRKYAGLFPKQLNTSQRIWLSWKRWVRSIPKKYDVAISYISGHAGYFVMDKVTADKKVLWEHSDYQKHGYDAVFDRPYFDACDCMIAVSQECRESILHSLPQYRNKLFILENITVCSEVIRQSRTGSCSEYEKADGIRLLSVGRLSKVKGFDLAVCAAMQLRDAGIPFVWLIVGEGSERANLQAQIDAAGLMDRVKLIGARENPYIYMRECDILVQTSRYEGKSIVLDEAKILCKPIVTTNYSTVHASVEHGKNGWIVEMDAEAVCLGIRTIWEDSELRKEIVERLKNAPKGNEAELKRYMELMF